MPENALQRDWLAEATGEKIDLAFVLGPHYSNYITEADAQQIAMDALEIDGVMADIFADEYCDLRGLYGDARYEVSNMVLAEYVRLADYFDVPVLE